MASNYFVNEKKKKSAESYCKRNTLTRSLTSVALSSSGIHAGKYQRVRAPNSSSLPQRKSFSTRRAVDLTLFVTFLFIFFFAPPARNFVSSTSLFSLFLNGFQLCWNWFTPRALRTRIWIISPCPRPTRTHLLFSSAVYYKPRGLHVAGKPQSARRWRWKT